jgi:hypothetical protein
MTHAALMERAEAAMVFTDSPYNVPIDGHVSGLGSIRHREFAMACGEMNEAQFIGFLAAACGLAARHSRDGAIHFICMDWRHLGELLAAAHGSIPSSRTSACGSSTTLEWVLLPQST